MEKNKVKFCWECGRKLYGSCYIIKFIEGNNRVLHKSCGKLYPKAKIIATGTSVFNNYTENILSEDS